MSPYMYIHFFAQPQAVIVLMLIGEAAAILLFRARYRRRRVYTSTSEFGCTESSLAGPRLSRVQLGVALTMLAVLALFIAPRFQPRVPDGWLSTPMQTGWDVQLAVTVVAFAAVQKLLAITSLAGVLVVLVGVTVDRLPGSARQQGGLTPVATAVCAGRGGTSPNDS